MIPTNTQQKTYIDEEALMLDGFRLGKQIFESGFKPDFIVGIWRGGSAVGMVVQECLQHLGVKTDHFPIRTAYEGMQGYNDMIIKYDRIKVRGLEYLVENLSVDHKLLLVDDVFSSGYSVQAVINKLRKKMRQNMPKTVRVAATWYRPTEGRDPPDYYVNETDHWLVLPYEITGLSNEEIAANKPWLLPMLKLTKS